MKLRFWTDRLGIIGYELWEREGEGWTILEVC